MLYLMICIAVGVVSACIQNYFCKNLFRVQSDNLLYQLIIYFIGIIVSLFTVRLSQPSAYTVHLGLIVGVLIMAEVFCILQAMRCGPMSLTSLFSMAAMLIPVCLSPFLWGERMTPLQIAGTVLVVISMLLITDVPAELRKLRRKRAGKSGTPKEETAGQTDSVSLKWLLYAFGAFLFGGCCAIPEKSLVNSVYADQSGVYAIISFAVVCMISAAALVIRGIRGERPTLRITAKRIPLFLFLGTANAAVVLLIIESIKILPASVVYCTHNGGRLVLITAMDMLVFKQKLKPVQIAGMAAGLIAVLFLSM